MQVCVSLITLTIIWWASGQSVEVDKTITSTIIVPTTAMLSPSESPVLEDSSLSKIIRNIATEIRTELREENESVPHPLNENNATFVLKLERDPSVANSDESREAFQLEIKGMDTNVVSHLCHSGGEGFEFSEENVIRRLHLQEALQNEFAARAGVNTSLIEIGKVRKSRKPCTKIEALIFRFFVGGC